MNAFDAYITGMARLNAFIESEVTRRTQQALAINAVTLCILFAITLILIKPAVTANRTPNEYIPVDAAGRVITPIAGAIPIHDDEFIIDYTMGCMHRSLTLTPGNYRREFMRFAINCMTPAASSQWSRQLQSSGIFDLVQDGSILEFTPNRETTKVIAKTIHNGRYLWRVKVSGTLTRVHERSDTSAIDIEVVIARQDPFNYEHAIAIQQVIL